MTWKYKYVTTVNDLVYTFIKSYNDDASDSRKQVQTSKEPIKDTHVHNTSVETNAVDSIITGVGIIGRGGRRDISGGTSIISNNVITYILTDSRKMILKSNSFPLNHLKSKTLMIASQPELFLSCDRNVRASSEIGDSRPDHGRKGTPFVNKKIWSGDDNFSVQVTPEKRINLTLPFSTLRPMKGIRYLRELKKKVLKVSSLKSLRSPTQANG